jgi:basic amino acid/polyamine antiporter, APA family
MQDENSSVKKIGLLTTVALVISNMIGTGVFTSLGYQYKDIPNALVILVLWVIGGILALFGALVYSELGVAMPRSGGEYHYLSKIYHPWLGFLSGWVSITVGFAAPVAIASFALGDYLHGVFSVFNPKYIAVTVIIIVTIIHAYDIKVGGNFQKIFTTMNILLILTLVVCGYFVTPAFQDISVHVKSFDFKDFIKPEIAVALIFVSYAYSGWNATAYIASDIKKPQSTIPKSLLMSTLSVTLLYLLLNFTFIMTAPRSELILDENIKNPGLISAFHIFGRTGGSIMGILISLLLVSTISSMIFVGPRVTQVIGEDMKIFKFISFKSAKHGTPVYAIIMQSAISIILILTSSFDTVLTSTGFALAFFTLLAVLGVFIHRIRFKDSERPYRTWGYPVVPVVFLLIVIWTLYFTFVSDPKYSIFFIVAVVSGSVVYLINLYVERRKIESEKNNS